MIFYGKGCQLEEKKKLYKERILQALLNFIRIEKRVFNWIIKWGSIFWAFDVKRIEIDCFFPSCSPAVSPKKYASIQLKNI